MRTVRSSLRTTLSSLGILIVCAASAWTAPPALTTVEVFPPEITLNTSRARQMFIIKATYADGITRDVTGESKAAFANPALARLDKNMVYPVADGATQLKVDFGGQSVAIPVKVQDAKTDRPISFKLDVMPVFIKAGCNVGGCHGAARGKDGFRLSLFGYDPEGDYYRLTREINGRRINLALPSESLIVEKATGRVPHTGGERFTQNSEHYQTIMRWLEAGAPMDPPTVATPVSADLYPKNGVLE